MRTNKLTQLAAIALTFSFAAGTFPAFAGAGHSEGNGGDGVYVDGKLVLRDFATSSTIVLDNKAFLEGIPEFMVLLKEIAQVYPSFVTAIWADLAQTRIWQTDQPLRLLPAGQTGLTAHAAEEQIAIRADDDIIFSMPAFLKTEREYVLLHEGLHGLLNGSGPFHHEKVRALVKLFRDKRGNYSKKQLQSAFRKIGLRLPYEGLGRSPEQNEFKDNLLRTLLLEEGSFEMRCSLIALIKIEWTVLFTLMDESMSGIEAWSQYESCGAVDGYAPFARLYPALDRLRKLDSTFVWPTYKVTPTKDRDLKSIYIEQCKRYGSIHEEARNRSVDEVLSAAQREMEEVQELDVSSLDAATKLYLQVVIDYQPSGTGPLGGTLRLMQIREYLEKQHESWMNFRSNVASCSRIFGSKVLATP